MVSEHDCDKHFCPQGYNDMSGKRQETLTTITVEY